MTAKSTVIALVSATLFLGTSAAMATLAVDRDRGVIRSAADPASCPPEACSIVVKTEVGGAPSRILAPLAPIPSRSQNGAVLVAEADR